MSSMYRDRTSSPGLRRSQLRLRAGVIHSHAGHCRPLTCGFGVELRGIEPLTSSMPCSQRTVSRVRQRLVEITQSESIQRPRPAETPSASGEASQRYGAVLPHLVMTGNVSTAVAGYVRGYVSLTSGSRCRFNGSAQHLVTARAFLLVGLCLVFCSRPILLSQASSWLTASPRPLLATAAPVE
jgi:hypothetical protein